MGINGIQFVLNGHLNIPGPLCLSNLNSGCSFKKKNSMLSNNALVLGGRHRVLKVREEPKVFVGGNFSS